MAKIFFDGKTRAEWIALNPVLGEGEIVYETDTRKIQVGDGSTSYSALVSATNAPPKTEGQVTLYNQREQETFNDYVERSLLSFSYNNVWFSNNIDSDSCEAYLPNIVNLPIGSEVYIFNNSGLQTLDVKLYPASYNQFESPPELPNNGTNSHNNMLQIAPQKAYRLVKGMRGLGWSVFKVEQLNSSHVSI